jgi:hypothetical protein
VQSVRWLLILPVAVVAWHVALIVGVGLYVGIESLCPTSQIVSGQCVAPWFGKAAYAVVALGAALAAFLIVIGCAWVAPDYKRQVAIATFSVGTIVAIVMGVSASDRSILISMAAAIVTGGSALAIVLRRLAPSSPPNASLERTRDR